jgi:hypothetical protein
MLKRTEFKLKVYVDRKTLDHHIQINDFSFLCFEVFFEKLAHISTLLVS